MLSIIGTTPVALKDSGERRETPTGSQRDLATGKGRFDLLPPHAMWDLSRLYEAGCLKYGDRNWEKGQPLSWYMSSAMRHMNWHLAGYTDERHDLAAAWNIMCLIETQHRIKMGELPAELDDLPPRRPPEQGAPGTVQKAGEPVPCPTTGFCSERPTKQG